MFCYAIKTNLAVAFITNQHDCYQKQKYYDRFHMIFY